MVWVESQGSVSLGWLYRAARGPGSGLLPLLCVYLIMNAVMGEPAPNNSAWKERIMAEEEHRSERNIDSPRDREEYPGQTLVTQSHDVISEWARERDGQPATVPDSDFFQLVNPSNG